MDSKKLLDLTVEAIDERHGEDTEAYDMQGISILADYYVVTTAGSNRQLHAIVNSIIDKIHEQGKEDYRIEGTRDSNWLLVDMGDVVEMSSLRMLETFMAWKSSGAMVRS